MFPSLVFARLACALKRMLCYSADRNPGFRGCAVRSGQVRNVMPERPAENIYPRSQTCFFSFVNSISVTELVATLENCERVVFSALGYFKEVDDV